MGRQVQYGLGAIELKRWMVEEVEGQSGSSSECCCSSTCIECKKMNRRMGQQRGTVQLRVDKETMPPKGRRGWRLGTIVLVTTYWRRHSARKLLSPFTPPSQWLPVL